MHQSSFRILRWTEDDRPYTKDFQDLFCTLVVALPLGVHRVRLQKKHNSFTTGEAISSLSNLRFTQSNRRPSPDDPNIMVTTKIATTFSMVPSMARYLCTKFLAARLIESVESKTNFNDASSTWQLTPKGISLLQSFAHRNGVSEKKVFDLLDSRRNTMNLLVLEREPETDQLNTDRQTAEVIFRRFAGIDGPNMSTNPYNSDSDSPLDFPNGLVGVRISSERKHGNKLYHKTFTGKAAVDWLMNCCTLADEREAHDIAQLFLDNGFIELLHEDRAWLQVEGAKFPCTKQCLYRITEEGQRAAKWTSRRRDLPNGTPDLAKPPLMARDSNNNRMMIIVSTPSLRLLFREFLRDTHCEENLVFYLEVKDFLGRWVPALRKYTDDLEPPLETTREILAAAYDLYNAFLAPGSPCELNIDHNLRNALVGRMTKFELPDADLHSCVKQIIFLYDQAQGSVFKLMASDSVPKFLRDPRYSQALHDHNAEAMPSPKPPTASRLATPPTVTRIVTAAS